MLPTSAALSAAMLTLGELTGRGQRSGVAAEKRVKTCVCEDVTVKLRDEAFHVALILLLFVPVFISSITFGFQYFSLAIKKGRN